MSCHARDLLESAPKVDTLEEAIEDTDIVIGTSGIAGIKTDQHIRMPAFTPAEIRDKFRESAGKIAFLFGREDNGFTREELKRCDMIMTIPTSEKYPIMNISHAATVAMYEMSNLEIGERPIANGFDLQLLYDHFEQVLAYIKHPTHKMEKTSLMLKRIFGRAELTPREVQTLRGVLRDIQRSKK
jgi:tRNA/rRNA methyltransferase